MSNESAVLTGNDYEELLPLVTAEHLGSYVRATRGSTADAFAFYEWNMHAAASVMELTSMVEVVSRNALDTQLRDWTNRKHGNASWFYVVPVDIQGRKDIQCARDRATHRGRKSEVHGRVVAELLLAFWR